MKGLATVQILKEIEKGTGKQIHEMFDLICGTSTGGMLAVALGIKLMSLGKCEDIYKNLGEPDNHYVNDNVTNLFILIVIPDFAVKINRKTCFCGICSKG